MSDQEELDYHITIPPYPPSPKRLRVTTEHKEFEFVYEKHNRPVVILLGWAGCRDKYLAKYSAIYEEKSCITLRYTAPVECLFWRRDKMLVIGKRLLQVIMQKDLRTRPIFFHIFSNGGAFLYQHISREIRLKKLRLDIRGLIFDSAPGARRLTTLYKAISAIIGGNPITNIPMSFFLTIFLSILWLIEVVTDAIGYGYTVQTNPIMLVEDPCLCPQLFLYSNADDLIPAADVEKFARRRARIGVHVEMVLFMNTDHVKHFVTYRDVYMNTIYTFMYECLRSPFWVPFMAKRVVPPSKANKQ